MNFALMMKTGQIWAKKEKKIFVLNKYDKYISIGQLPVWCMYLNQ